MKMLKQSVSGYPHLHRIIACEERLEEAVHFLVEALDEPRRGKKPVLLHSLRVSFWLLSGGFPVEVVIAGLLHDVIEKTRVTPAQISRRFGIEVGHMVAATTNSPKFTNVYERYADSLQRCQDCGKGALVVRAADLIDNCDRLMSIGSRNRFARIAEKLRMLIEVGRSAELDPHLLQELVKRRRRLIKVNAIALVPKKDSASAKTPRLPSGNVRYR